MVAIRDRYVEEAQRELASQNEIYLSYWSFTTHRLCPQRYALDCVVRRPRPPTVDSFWAINGSIVHSLWESFTKEVKYGGLEWTNRDYLHDNVDKHYNEFMEREFVDWQAHDTSKENYEKEALPQVHQSVDYVFNVLSGEGLIPCDPETVQVERPLKTMLVPGVKIAGRPDLVFERSDGLIVVDLKDVWSKSNLDWRQLIWYAFLCEPHYPGKRVKRAGFLMPRLGEWSWRNPDSRNYRINLKREILETALKIKREPFTPKPDRFKCTRCPVQSLCPEWSNYTSRTAELLNSVVLMSEGNVSF